MSVESLSKALHIPGLTTIERIVLVGIANHDGDGGAWPSIATLAGYACVSTRTIQRVIPQLETKGLIEVVQNAGGNSETRGDRRPNLYRLHLSTTPVYGVTQGVTPSDNGATNQASRGDTAVSPEPPLEPSSLTFEHVFTRAELIKTTQRKRDSTPNKRQHIIDQTRAQRLTDMRPQPPIDIAATALLGEEHSLTYWLAEQTPHDLDDNEETLTRAERERLIEFNRLTHGAKPG